MAPLCPMSPIPDEKIIEPPVLFELDPPTSVIIPGRPTLSPTFIWMPPAIPAPALPVLSNKDPVFPIDEVPVNTPTEPVLFEPVPELNSNSPLYTPDPEEICTLPPVPSLLCPEAKIILPPFPDKLLPDITLIWPVLPKFESPVTTLISPLSPANPLPVCTNISPESALSPEARFMSPLKSPVDPPD